MRGDTIQQRGRNDLPQIQKEFERVKEKVEILNGERGDSTKTFAAVRRSDFRTLARITQKSSQLAAAPTQADFNALQADVATILAALRRISNISGAS
jgi:uncharacterized protein YlxW (UPF0749 family)